MDRGPGAEPLRTAPPRGRCVSSGRGGREMGWKVLKWVLVAAGIALLASQVVGIVAARSAASQGELGPIPEVERTFEGPGADQVEPFDAQLERANTRVGKWEALSARERSWVATLRWAVLAVTAVYVVLVAIVRVSPNREGAPPRFQRLALLISVVVLAAVYD